METNKKEQNQEKNKAAQQQNGSEPIAKKQEQPLKNHGVPEDPEEERIGGLKGAENFKRNMGCGG